jgi:tight adherence protein C
MPPLLILALTLVAAALSVRLFIVATVRRRSIDMVETAIAELPGAVQVDREERGLAAWLMRAGYRGPSTSAIFLGATAGAAALSLAFLYLLKRLGTIENMQQSLAIVPGGIGDVMAAVAGGTGYILFAICTAAPLLVVRAARRKRVEMIEQDLASVLELMATLAEAGLGFDSAIARIQESESGGRPLAEEFRIYQRDVLGGIPRPMSLRRMAARVDLTSVAIFISAVIQAEQVGSSLAETLRTQSDDLRDRRKLRALLLAQALPVKLVFPLMFCFLPGIFYSTLGPVLAQLVDVVDSVLKR